MGSLVVEDINSFKTDSFDDRYEHPGVKATEPVLNPGYHPGSGFVVHDLVEESFRMMCEREVLLQQAAEYEAGARTIRSAIFKANYELIEASFGSDEEGIKNLDKFRNGYSERYTTVMLRHIPNNVTRKKLLEVVKQKRFKFDFLYYPIDFSTGSGLGFAFINFESPEEAVWFWAELIGFNGWGCQSNKICELAWGGAEQQGLQVNVERYKNSPIMHPDVSDEHKPLLFKDGQPLEFPPPTKKLKPPHHKHAKKRS